MSDSEKPLKVISGIVSGLLVVSALIFFIFALGKPKEAEAALEYAAPPGFAPSELTSALHELRKDQGFLVEIAIRSKFVKTSDPDLAQVAAKLGSRLTFEANLREPAVSILFAHPKAATAIDVTNAAAAVAKERLESHQQKLRMDVLIQEDAVEDKRKLLEQIRRIAALPAGDTRKKSDWGSGYSNFVDPQNDYECALRKLAELKAKPVFSISSIRAAKLTSN
jgi:hypothetical protein